MPGEMSFVGAVLRADFRATVRDRTTTPVLVLPLVFAALIRFGLPGLTPYVQGVPHGADLVLAVLCSVAAVLPSMVLGMNALDERDEGMFRAYRVLPVPMPVLFGIRLGWAFALGAANVLVVLWIGDPGRYSPAEVLALAAASAFACPVLTAAAVVHAGNKIEGLAVFKAMIFAHVLGALGLLTGSPWCFVFFALPSCWGYAAYAQSWAGSVFPSALTAVAFYSAILFHFARAFRRLRE